MTPECAADYLDHMIQAIDRIGAYTEALTVKRPPLRRGHFPG